jgi:hypothetical protein
VPPTKKPANTPVPPTKKPANTPVPPTEKPANTPVPPTPVPPTPVPQPTKVIYPDCPEDIETVLAKWGWVSKAHFEELFGINDADVVFVVEKCNGFEVHPRVGFQQGGFFEMHNNTNYTYEGTLHDQQTWGTVTKDHQTGIPPSTQDHYTLRVEGLSWWSNMYHP